MEMNRKLWNLSSVCVIVWGGRNKKRRVKQKSEKDEWSFLFSASKETDRREWRQRTRRAAANFHQVFDRVCRSTGRDLSIDRSATGQSPLDERIRRSLVRDNRESEENWIDGWINRYLHTILRKIESFFFFFLSFSIQINRNYKNVFLSSLFYYGWIVPRSTSRWNCTSKLIIMNTCSRRSALHSYFLFLYYQQVRLGSLKFYFYHLFQRIFETNNVKKNIVSILSFIQYQKYRKKNNNSCSSQLFIIKTYYYIFVENFKEILSRGKEYFFLTHIIVSIH